MKLLKIYPPFFVVLPALLLSGCVKKDEAPPENTTPDVSAVAPKKAIQKIPEKGARMYAAQDGLGMQETPTMNGKPTTAQIEDSDSEPFAVTLREGEPVVFTGDVSEKSVISTAQGKSIEAPFYKVRYERSGRYGFTAEGWIFAGALSETPIRGKSEYFEREENFHNMGYALDKGNKIALFIDENLEIDYLWSDRCSGTMRGKITIKGAQLDGAVDIPVKQTKDGWMDGCAKDITSVSFDFYKIVAEAVKQGGKFSPMGESAGYELNDHNSISITLFAYDYAVTRIEYKLEDPG